MKKTLIALAVAGTFAAPAMAASSNVDIYGKMRVSVDYVNSKAVSSDAWTINDRVSRVGIKGSEDLGGGLKALWQWESQMNGLDSATVGTTQRNTFVGLAGGFGTVLAGVHDTPYKLAGSADLFGDTAADAQRAGAGIIGRNNFDQRATGTIAYISPTWSGFHFAAAVVPGEEAGGAAASNDANGLMDAYSLAAVYANGPLKLTAGYENYSGDIQSAAVTTAADRDAFKLNVAYKIGDIGLGYTYERSDDIGVAATHTTDTAHLASVSYGMGPITLALQHGRFNDKNGTATDLKRTTLGAMYAMSKRTGVYAAYNMDNFGTGGTDVDTFTMGLNHDF